MKLNTKETAEMLLDEMKHKGRLRPYICAYLESLQTQTSSDSDRACKAHYRNVSKWMTENWKGYFKAEEEGLFHE